MYFMCFLGRLASVGFSFFLLKLFRLFGPFRTSHPESGDDQYLAARAARVAIARVARSSSVIKAFGIAVLKIVVPFSCFPGRRPERRVRAHVV